MRSPACVPTRRWRAPSSRDRSDLRDRGRCGAGRSSSNAPARSSRRAGAEERSNSPLRLTRDSDRLAAPSGSASETQRPRVPLSAESGARPGSLFALSMSFLRGFRRGDQRSPRNVYVRHPFHASVFICPANKASGANAFYPIRFGSGATRLTQPIMPAPSEAAPSIQAIQPCVVPVSATGQPAEALWLAQLSPRIGPLLRGLFSGGGGLRRPAGRPRSRRQAKWSARSCLAHGRPIRLGARPRRLPRRGVPRGRFARPQRPMLYVVLACRSPGSRLLPRI